MLCILIKKNKQKNKTKVLEYVGPTYRTMVANLSIALFYTAGTTLLPWIAWAINDWRMLSLATALPMASVVVAYWIVPESARYTNRIQKN